MQFLFRGLLLPEGKRVLSGLRTLVTASATETPTPETKEKLIKVAIIGAPNAGKSTFINNLINHRVCPTSNKVHTTRKTAKAIHVRNNHQMVLFDTPGLVTGREMKKHHLEQSFQSSPRYSIQSSNLIAVIHDISNNWTRNSLHPIVLETLEFYKKVPSFLILNKIDQLRSKRVLLDTINHLTLNTLAPPSGKGLGHKKKAEDALPVDESGLHRENLGWAHFSNVFMVSALTGDGLSDVLEFIYSHAKPGNWEFPANTLTDQSNEQIVEDSVRARLLDYLPQEIPYSLKSKLEYYDENKSTIYASVHVDCPNVRIERLVCGDQNGKLKQITERVTSDLVETFRKAISLTITTSSGKKV